MTKGLADEVFAGSVPELYDQYLVPLIFEMYATDLVARLQALDPSTVLEVAAGTGVVTRAMAAGLGGDVQITASDLNQPMVEHAQAIGTARMVEWKAADVMDLPFADDSFDAVVCQFGVMFFPDRGAAYAEVSRVLRPGGSFIFNVWDRIETNEFAAVVTDAVGEIFPDDPPRFLPRTPHGYYDRAEITSDLVTGGFSATVSYDPLESRSRAATADLPAIAYCQGTPLRNEIEARDPSLLAAATDRASVALAEQFGPLDLDSRIRGFVIAATKP